MIGNPRRLAVVSVSPDPLVCLRPGHVFRVIETDVPEGAEVLQVVFDNDRCVFNVYLQHDSFDETIWPKQIPRIAGPVFETLDPPRDAG